MEDILQIPLFDDDFYKMCFRFIVNITFLSLIIRWLYFTNSPKKDYIFTFYMIGIVVFFLCFTLKKFELDLGMALGLFAIFGIIRYRTNTIQIREMTYLFVVIGLSVINSLANQKMSFVELLTANLSVVITLYLLERGTDRRKLLTKSIEYNDLSKIKSADRDALQSELESLTGLSIEELDIGKIDLSNESVIIKIKYYE